MSVLLIESPFVATEAVENLFDKQRQEQEQVLRAVAAGESSRRFVFAEVEPLTTLLPFVGQISQMI